MKKDFLLTTALAGDLYKKCGSLPVMDYHNHLNLAHIRENKRFRNLYELWIQPDPYKHRAMRMCGIPERCITGDASEEEKFAAWCGIFPKLAGSPLYQWSLMELEDVLEIRDVPAEDNWKLIWKHGEGYLDRNEVSPKSIMSQYKVEYCSPCVTFSDDLSECADGGRITVSLRGDEALHPDKDFIEWLEGQTGLEIKNLESYFRALSVRIGEFRAAGCRFADHSLDCGFRYYEEDGKNTDRFERLLKELFHEKEPFANGAGKAVPTEEPREGPENGDEEMLAAAILRHLACAYARNDMTLQLHMGARRHTSTRLRQCAGAAGGYAAIGNSPDMVSLTAFLDDVERHSGAGLPRVILFALNPADHGMLSSLAGSYAKDHVPGLVTQGPAWWWCDHGHGIRSVLDNTASYGLLSQFSGMTTDSRSFLSFARHDYFRRILCSWTADRVRGQDMPNAPKLLEKLLYDMCYGNMRRIVDGK